MPDTANVVFVPTGNSCQPRNAEAWTRHVGSDEVIMHEFRATRDEVEYRVGELFDTMNDGEAE